MSTTTELSETLLQLSSSASSSSSSSSSLNELFRRIESKSNEEQLQTYLARDSSGRSALHFACQHGHHQLAAKLLHHIRESQVAASSAAALSQLLVAADGLGQTALHWALKTANEAAKSANQSPTSSSSSSAAAATASSSAAPVLKCVSLILDVEEKSLLLQQQPSKNEEAHVDKKAKFEHGSESASGSSSSFVLSTATSCLFVRDSFGRVPLHWTVAFPDVLMRVVQLQAGIASSNQSSKSSFIDTQTVSGETALHYAASDNNVAALDILLSAGASLDLKNNRGESVMDVCRSDEARGVVSAWAEKARVAAEKVAADAASKPKDELETVSASSLMASSTKSTTAAAGGAPKKKVAIKLKK